MKKYKVILSGGGTGGHIFPAVAVAEELKKRLGDGVDILFVGAEGKMEMEKIPALGYDIKGVTIAGIQRKLSAKNLSLPYKIVKSVRQAKRIIREFGADIVVGFGGYASGPVLWSAQRMGIPTIIQEQNSFAGITNKLLAKKAKKICVAYDKMDRYFPAASIVHTGNPLRGSFSAAGVSRGEALEHFGLAAGKPVILITGGSLGTRSLNEMMKKWVDTITSEEKVQVIWQTGKYYAPEMDEYMRERNNEGIWRGPFIDRMDMAYAAADVVISRSGACTVSELSLVGKPVIFVPSPNVAEDHQTKNAMALVEKGAAICIPDSRAVDEAIPMAMELAQDEERKAALSAGIRKLATPDAASDVAGHIMELLEKEDNK